MCKFAGNADFVFYMNKGEIKLLPSKREQQLYKSGFNHRSTIDG